MKTNIFLKRKKGGNKRLYIEGHSHMNTLESATAIGNLLASAIIDELDYIARQFTEHSTREGKSRA
jgi:hypothetical protein